MPQSVTVKPRPKQSRVIQYVPSRSAPVFMSECQRLVMHAVVELSLSKQPRGNVKRSQPEHKEGNGSEWVNMVS